GGGDGGSVGINGGGVFGRKPAWGATETMICVCVMSAFDTKRTCQSCCSMSAFGGKADISQRLPANRDFMSIFNSASRSGRARLPELVRWRARDTSQQARLRLAVAREPRLSTPAPC